MRDSSRYPWKKNRFRDLPEVGIFQRRGPLRQFIQVGRGQPTLSPLLP